MRPLEGERATKWRGGAVRQEPQMTTPPRQAAVWRSGQPLRFISTRSLVHPFAAALAPLKTVRSQSTAEPPRAEEHIGMGGKNLNLLNPMNPGRGAAHPAAPFRLAALATHPREGGGQVTWRRGTLPQTLPIPFCGGKEATPFKLASHRSSGGGGPRSGGGGPPKAAL